MSRRRRRRAKRCSAVDARCCRNVRVVIRAELQVRKCGDDCQSRFSMSQEPPSGSVRSSLFLSLSYVERQIIFKIIHTCMLKIFVIDIIIVGRHYPQTRNAARGVKPTA